MPRSKQIIRLAYASQSTSGVHELKDHLTNILATAQYQNARHNICGVLCFGNGYFFQVIEGYRTDIERLHQALNRDERHHDMTILVSYEVKQTFFYTWSMKYVRLDESLSDFLSEHQLLPFNPMTLSVETVERLIQYLYQQTDHSEGLDLPRVTSISQSALSDTGVSPIMSHLGLIMIMVGLGIGLLVLALMGFTSFTVPQV